MYFDRFFFNDPSQKKRTVCFLQILGTISNAIDVFSFYLRALVLKSGDPKVNMFRDPCFWWYGICFFFFFLFPWVSQRGQGQRFICWFLSISFICACKNKTTKKKE